MIYLNQMLYDKVVKEIHEAKDYADMAHDLLQISEAISHINMPDGYENAQMLDKSLREKYPDIEAFLKLADSLIVRRPVIASQPSTEVWEIARLNQDRCGIICHAAVKKGITQTIEQMIDSVD